MITLSPQLNAEDAFPRGLVHVPAGHDFAQVAAQFVAEHWPRDAWPEGFIFVPSKGSVRAVRDAFLSIVGNGSALLPAILPLGDIDARTLALLSGQRPTADAFSTRNEHQALLHIMRAVAQFYVVRHIPISRKDVASLARSLITLRDEAVRFGADMSRLPYLVSGDHAAYWRDSARFLSIVFGEDGTGADWLRGYADLHVKSMKLAAEIWQQHPPAFPVMVAGSTGSQPLTADFMRVVAALPKGVVLLPSLSAQARHACSADELMPGHPMYHPLRFAASTAEMVGEAALVHNENATFMANLFAPQPQPLPMPETLKPIACDDEWHEARVVAIIIREALADSAKSTLMVISPDRDTLKRIKIELSRWGIVPEVSSAETLSRHSYMQFVSLLLALFASRAAVADVLAFFQHTSLYAKDATQHASYLHTVDMHYARIAGAERSTEAFLKALKPFSALVDALSRCAFAASSGAPVAAWLAAISAVAEVLGVDTQISEEINEAFADLGALQDEMLSLDEFQSLIESLGEKPWFGGAMPSTHARVQLHTPLEARLQSADIVVLAGLNEGVWPSMPRCPWLNQSMRASIGLPGQSHELSLQAHDFLEASSTADVFLTRPQRVSHAVAMPSRFWQRVVLSQPALSSFHREVAHRYTSWAHALDVVPYAPITPPRPNPPVSARPRSLRITQFESLLFNPYDVYVTEILRLKPLDEQDKELDGREFGTFMHKLLEEAGTQLAELTPESIDTMVDKCLRRFVGDSRLQILWKDRLKRGVQFCIDKHRELVEMIATLEVEKTLTLEMPLSETEVLSLRGKADRIHTMKDGSLAVVDVKTSKGKLSTKAITEGRAPQLSLYHIAAKGAFDEANLSYWIMPQGDDEGDVVEASLSPENMKALFALYVRHAQHYLINEQPFLYSPYMHTAYTAHDALARAAEWGGVEPEEMAG